jgi:hypothetical protein
MNSFYEVFQYGFTYLFSLQALPHIALLVAFFAILKITDIKKGLILIFCFSSGFLVNLLLLSFQIFTIQNKYWGVIVTLSTMIFALWNFSYKSSPFRRRSSNLSSRYLVSFILGILHGILIYFNETNLFGFNQLTSVFGFWSGLFVANVTVLVIDFVVLWIITNFFRVKDVDWLLVVTGISLGLSFALLRIF